MWISTPETDRIEDLLRAMAASLWGVPLEGVALQRVDGPHVGVVLHHRLGLRWEWYKDTEECNVGTLGILNLALDAYREDLNRRADAIRNALDVYDEAKRATRA